MPDLNTLPVMAPMGMQAFWIWLTLGILLLGTETVLGTNWLLWMASVAGLVAVICLTTLPFGFPIQVAVFAILSGVLILFTKRILRPPGTKGHIDDPSAHMLGRQAVVLSGFGPVVGGERTGRVMFDGVEWPAVVDSGMDTQQPVAVDDKVEIAIVQDGRLHVKTSD